MNMRNNIFFLGAVSLLVAIAGCSPSAGPLAQFAGEVKMAGEPASDMPDAVFMGELAAQDRVNQNDGFRAVLIWADGKDESKNFKQRAVTLAAKGFLKTRWRLNPAAPLDKGTLAYMVFKALDLRGGVNMAIFNSRRYALRELVYNGMMARGADYTYVSGSEFIAILGRADDYRNADAGKEHEQLPEPLRD